MTRPDIEQRLTERAQEGDDYLSPTALWLQPEDVALLREAAEEIRRLREFYEAYVEVDEASKDYNARLEAWKAGDGKYPSFAGTAAGLCRMEAARAALNPTEPND